MPARIVGGALVQPPTVCEHEDSRCEQSGEPRVFAVFGWLKGYQLANGGRALGYWSYWNPTGPLSGPWLPADTATIAALNSIGLDAPT